MRIRCITDQLNAYTKELLSVIEMIEKRGYSREEAIKITELSIENMKNEILWDKNTIELEK